MVFVITNSVRGDIVHFLLWQGRLKNWIPQKGPPPKPNQKCKCIYYDQPYKCPTKKCYASFLFVQRRRESSQGAALSEKLQLVNLGNGSYISLSWTNSLWAFALEGFHFIFEKGLCWPMLITQGLWASVSPLNSVHSISQFSALAHFKWIFDILISNRADWSH